MATTRTVTLTPDSTGCWCATAKPLIERAVERHHLWGAGPSPLLLTGVTHAYQCWLRFDGGLMWAFPPWLTELSVTVTDAEAAVWGQLAEPIRLDGAVTLGDALRVVSTWYQRKTYARQILPQKTDRLLRDIPLPVVPSTAASTYTRGRVRRTPDGRWAAEIGHGGTLRTVGERSTPEEAETATLEALDQTRDQLQGWLAEHIEGAWEIRWPPVQIDRVEADAAQRDVITAAVNRLTARHPEHADLIAALATLGISRQTEDDLLDHALNLGVGVLGDLDIAVLTGRDRTGIYKRRQKTVTAKPTDTEGTQP